MRTTLNLEDDVLRAVEELRDREGLGLSAAVNQLVRRSLVESKPNPPYRVVPTDLGMKIDVTNIGEVLAFLDEG